MIRDTDWHSFTERFPTLLTEKLSERRLRNSGVVREVGAGDVLYRNADPAGRTAPNYPYAMWPDPTPGGRTG